MILCSAKFRFWNGQYFVPLRLGARNGRLIFVHWIECSIKIWTMDRERIAHQSKHNRLKIGDPPPVFCFIRHRRPAWQPCQSDNICHILSFFPLYELQTQITFKVLAKGALILSHLYALLRQPLFFDNSKLKKELNNSRKKLKVWARFCPYKIEF